MIQTVPVQRFFVKPKSISQYLKCSICFDVFKQPKRTYCGHTFCKSCLQSCINSSGNCPNCRQKIKRNDVGDDVIANAIINQLQVLCPSQECPWRGQCILLEHHYQACQYKQKGSKKKSKSKSVKKSGPNLQDEDQLQMYHENVAKGSFFARIKAKMQSNGQQFSNFFSKTVQDISKYNVEKAQKSLPNKQQSVKSNDTANKRNLRKRKNNKGSKNNNIQTVSQNNIPKKTQKEDNFDFLNQMF